MKISRLNLVHAVNRPGKRGGMCKEFSVKDGYGIDLDPASGLIRVSLEGDERITHVSNLAEAVPVKDQPKPQPAKAKAPERTPS